MPFLAVCCCPFYSEWGFGDPRGSSYSERSAYQADINTFGGKQEGQKAQRLKRKNCVACANRIDTEGSGRKRLHVEVR